MTVSRLGAPLTGITRIGNAKRPTVGSGVANSAGGVLNGFATTFDVLTRAIDSVASRQDTGAEQCEQRESDETFHDVVLLNGFGG